MEHESNKEVADLKADLRAEEFLYTNMKAVLEERDTEIAELYNIIDQLMAKAKL